MMVRGGQTDRLEDTMDMLELARQRVKDIGDLETEEAYLPFAPVIAAEAQAAALIALAEQAKRIADALNSIDTVLVKASGSNGAIQIHSYTFDGERY
jgi:hypothetical protein